jgi:hypothetical protein
MYFYLLPPPWPTLKISPLPTLKIRVDDRALSSIYLLISRSRKTALLFDILPMYFVERAVPRRNSPN